MRTLIDTFCRLHLAGKSVEREWCNLINQYFGPLLQSRPNDVTTLQIEAWFKHIGETSSKSQANKCLVVCSLMFSRGKKWGLCTHNPAKDIEKYSMQERKRFVREHEMPKLMEALATQPEMVQCFFLLCLFVGCRKMEALTLKWEDLREERGQGLWEKSRTKTREAHCIPIPAELFGRLMKLPRLSDYVFAVPPHHWPSSTCQKKWEEIRTAAGLRTVRIHDLRRTCASWLGMHGENAVLIGKGVLGHTTLAHTGIYTRLNVSPVAKALEANSERMMKVTHGPHTA